MSDIIHLLPDSVANQIAAGEVIQRPASVLKELVENAIDAGATFIRIVLKDAGRTLIQVTDNGKGMSETDARMAFERHATSKIQSADDLFALRTMGFRGEALASIAAVAQVELRTRRDEDELGTFIEIAGTRVFKQESVQCSTGTTFQVKNLFFNVPARRRFLKSDNVEKNHILTEFYRIALVNPEIAFSLHDGEDEIYNLQPANLKLRVEQVFTKNSKKKWEQQLLSLETNTNMIRISGYVGKPEFAQKSPHQYFFVNNRYMRHPYFHKAVMMAYDQMIQGSESPNYFIYFDVDPQKIDINIHPTKTEIKFEDEQSIWSILTATIKETLGKFNIAPSIDFDQEGAPEIPVNIPFGDVRPPQTNFNPNYNPFNASSSYKRPEFNWEKLYGSFEEQVEPIEAPAADNELIEYTKLESKLTAIETEATSTFSSAAISVYKEPEQQIIDETGISNRTENFQYKFKYIITGIKSGLLMIDQQRAHVRILSDMYLEQLRNSRGSSQQTLFPETLELSPSDVLFFEQIMTDLVRIGFDFEQENTHTFSVRGIPSGMENTNSIDLLYDLVDRAKQAMGDPTADIHENIALGLAKASALKPGQRLSQEEMSDLIDRLFACSNHNYTPDGKRIMTVFTQDELEKRF